MTFTAQDPATGTAREATSADLAVDLGCPFPSDPSHVHGRGPLSESLLSVLATRPRPVEWSLPLVGTAPYEDYQFALYCCYELHYGGLRGVDDEWEWEPSLLQLRRSLERRFEAELVRAIGPVRTDASRVVDDLWRLATSGGGPSLSGWALEHGSRLHAQELAVHRSAYQLKEADPHSWAIPRLEGVAKATLVAIQADEYGTGVADDMHASLFAETMRALGLDSTPGAYLDLVPSLTLATTNLISMLGLHRRLRGALVGHLALFEMTSVGPMGRYAAWMERLGLPAWGRRFYDVHVTADEVHQHLASYDMVGGLVAKEPALAPSVLFGALALSEVEACFTRHVLGRWQRGESSLRTGPVRPSNSFGTCR